MLIATLVLVALSAALAIFFLAELVPGRHSALTRRLAELEHGGAGGATVRQILRRRARQAQSEKLAAIIEVIGQRAQNSRRDVGALRLWLIQAGFAEPRAVPLYLGMRLFLPVVFGIVGFLVIPAGGFSLTLAGIIALWCAALGYILPAIYVGQRRKRRMKQMQLGLPDALDLLVVCVEAGLALNQALVRVAEEVERMTPVLSEQFELVNLEIRAGTTREEALRALGERTGLDDIKSLVAMLIQTDRFGTSIAQALRVQADTLRTKRRQQAEEEAAKTTIKLVFPLVLLIFPAMFVVILGPALIQILDTLELVAP